MEQPVRPSPPPSPRVRSLQDLTHLTARVLFGTYDNSNALFGVLAQFGVSLYLIQSVRIDQPEGL